MAGKAATPNKNSVRKNGWKSGNAKRKIHEKGKHGKRQ